MNHYKDFIMCYDHCYNKLLNSVLTTVVIQCCKHITTHGYLYRENVSKSNETALLFVNNPSILWVKVDFKKTRKGIH